MLQQADTYYFTNRFDTLHTAQCTLRTAPAHANAPEFEHVHFIQHIEQYTLHNTCVYYILLTSHITLQTSKICLTWSQYLHGEMYIDILN